MVKVTVGDDKGPGIPSASFPIRILISSLDVGIDFRSDPCWGCIGGRFFQRALIVVVVFPEQRRVVP